MLTESLKLFKARENQYEIADGLATLGLLALVQGNLSQAHVLHQEAVTVAASINFRKMLANWQPQLAIVTLYCGDALEARRLLDESLRLCLELKDKLFLARVCACLAEIDLWEGKLEGAELWLARSLAWSSVVEHPEPSGVE